MTSQTEASFPLRRGAYSYRGDPAVPAFPDDHPIIIFDGVCKLCSGWAKFVLSHDRAGTYRLLTAQSILARALYQHYGLDPIDQETNVLIANGVAWFKSEGTLRMFEGLGPPWSLARGLRILPLSARDRGYDFIARNRIKFFGQRASCFLPTTEIQSRFLA